MNNKDSPERGDLIWLDFSPQAGHEQSGRRPALVLSPRAYNQKTSLAIVCPITSSIKHYPFEVGIPTGLAITGVVLSDQVRSLDWKARHAQVICRLPDDRMDEVLEKIGLLLHGDTS